MAEGNSVFPVFDPSPVVTKSILASVGSELQLRKPTVAIISTGTELLVPYQPVQDGKIFDSNTTMLDELLLYFGFECMQQKVLSDE